jgi:hypothetical protein
VEYQAGFRPGTAITHQLFTVRQINGKFWECNLDLYEIFIDFCQAYDNILREKLYEALHALKMPEKLIRSIKATMKDTTAQVRIQI